MPTCENRATTVFCSDAVISDMESGMNDIDLDDYVEIMRNPSVKNFEFGREAPFDVAPNNFKWTSKSKLSLMKNVNCLKPTGINKHMYMLMISEVMSNDLKLNMPTNLIWNYLNSKWDMLAADKFEIDSGEERDFNLSKDYDSLVVKMKEKVKKDLEKNNENNKKKFPGAGKTRSKSNSISSTNFKDGYSEAFSTPTDSISVKTSAVGSEVLSSRRSLRTNDKIEDKESVDSLNRKKVLRIHSSSEDHNKSKDLKQLNQKKTSNQLNDSDKNVQMSNTRNLKRKSRNVSESSVNSEVSKQPRSSRSNAIDLAFLDSSSRSVTPEISRSKSFNQFAVPEKINRKSNLRSGNKDLKNKSLTDIGSTKSNPNESALLISCFKTDKNEKQVTKLTPKQVTPGKDESNQTKNKPRGRLTSDYLVVHQAPEIQVLGRRSFNRS